MSTTGSILLAAALAAQGPQAAPEAASGVDDEVAWDAPAGCPDRAFLLDGIARRRGHPLEPGSVRVDARVTTFGPRHFRLSLTIDAGGRHESRVLGARSCAALVDAAALRIALAVAVDAGVALSEAPSEAPDEPPSEGAADDEAAPGSEAVTPGQVAPPDPSLDPIAHAPVAVAVAVVEAPEVLPPTEALESGPVDAELARRRRRAGGFLRLSGLRIGGIEQYTSTARCPPGAPGGSGPGAQGRPGPLRERALPEGRGPGPAGARSARDLGERAAAQSEISIVPERR